jgi:hypothetical protein
VTYGGDRFVAVGFSGTVFWSIDGDIWNAAANPPGGPDPLRDVVYADGYFMAVGDNGSAHKSTADASTWCADSNPAGSANGFTGVAYGGTHVVIAGTFGESYWSNNGTAWSADTFTAADHLQDVVYADGQFNAVSNSGHVFHSADGTAWDAGFGPGLPNEFYNIAYGNGRYVTVGSLNGDTVAYWSSDGTTWNASESVTDVPILYAIAYLP